MKCGVSLKTRAISAGSGMLLIMKRVMCWRMSLATEKMSFSSSLKGFWNLSAFNIITRMIGGLMNSSYLKSNTQKIERKLLTLRTRIKRLARKTICFSKLEKLHDIVIGLFINRFEFGVAV